MTTTPELMKQGLIIKKQLTSTLLGITPVQKLTEVHCYIDADIKTELEQFWLTYLIDSKVNIHKDEQSIPRLFVRALTPDKSDNFLQHIYQYGAKIEIIGPPELREQIRQKVEELHTLYS